MPGVFVCYQRKSTRHVAGRLYSHLARRFGSESVFRDTARLRGGEKWWQEITAWIGQADALIAVMGRDWLELVEAANAEAAPEAGWVQREIVLAREQGVAVIPVLVDEAEMPPADALPEPLRPLADIHAWTLHDDTFDHQMGLLDQVLEEDHGLQDPRSPARRRWELAQKWLRPTGTVLGAVAAALTIWAFCFGGENRPPVLADLGRLEAVGGIGTSFDLLSSASDPDGDALALSVDEASSNGAEITNQGDGTVAYAAPREFFGDDRFDFEVVDEHGAVTAGTAFVGVRGGEMGGALNVAVADFAAVGGPARPLALAASQAILGLVAEGMEDVEGLRVEVAGPDRTGPVGGEAFAQQVEAVLEPAGRLAADAVIFGVVSSDGGSTDVRARLHLTGRGLAGADELAGSYELDRVTVSASSPGPLELELDRVMRPIVAALADMMQGLAFYQVNRYPEAEAALREAVAGWPVTADSTIGQEVLWHLLGNIAGEQGRLDDAAGFYETAVAIGDDDARARFGLAEVQFLRSRGEACGGEGEPDPALLDDAIAAFEAVRRMPEPPGSFLRARVGVEIGRIQLCLTLRDVDRASEARAELEAVIAEYAEESRLRDLIGEAHQALGLYHTLQGDVDAAIAAYETAIATTNEEARRAFFHIALGRIYECDLENPGAAAEQYRLSDALVSEPLPRPSCDGM